MIAERGEHAWNVDTFLLSCRVLGRGVEHQIASALGQMAANAGARTMKLRVDKTNRNTPARAFLESVTPPELRRGDERALECELPSEVLAAIRFEPVAPGEIVVQEESGSIASREPIDASRVRRREQQIARAAFELATGADLRTATQRGPQSSAT